MRISDIETPAIIIDLDIMEANLRKVADYSRRHNLRLRPHTKTHKISELGRRQIDLGAAGLTVAKVGEAEIMAAATPDLLVAYPVIGRGKLERLMNVARLTSITVSLDSMAAARPLSDAAREANVEVGVLVETDAGMGRVGVPPEQLVDLGRAVAKLPHLRLHGFAFYPGHIRSFDDEGRDQMRKLSQLVNSLVQQFKSADLPVNVVSGGSTPTLYHSHEVAGLNEIRPGTYIFNDRNTVEGGGCLWDDCAAQIVATVVSTPREGHMVIDGGSKTFSSDRLGSTGEATFGLLREAPGAVFHKMNEEHGYIDLRRAERTDFQVGERVHIIPNHICVAMNLHEQVYGVRKGEVEQIWKVEARGKLQ